MRKKEKSSNCISICNSFTNTTTIILLLLLLLLLLTCTFGINAQQISIPSPTAANLGLYGEIPVSYYTGTPNISIPLYEIKGKHVTVPIEISYHPAGIRPENHPGPVGLGWSLSAGGVISRTVRGKGPDDNDYGGRIGIVEGYLNYTGGWIAQNNWKDNAKNVMDNDCSSCEHAVRFTSPYSDLEPDEFSFSFLNISGKFYFDHTGAIQVQSDHILKVIFNNEFINPWEDGIKLTYSESYNYNRSFKSFTIIDEQGTQYSFGGATAIEFSDPISYGRKQNGYGIPASGELLQATSWFLTQIKSADGADVINFEYERGPFVSQLYRSFDYYESYDVHGDGYQINNLTIDGTLISPVYLQKITRNSEEVISLAYSQSNDIKYGYDKYTSVLYPASANDYKLLDQTSAIPRFQINAPNNKFDRIQWLKLDVISVNNMNLLVRRISFSYNNISSERLFLESLNIRGPILLGENPLLESPFKYTFTYKNKDRLPGQYLTCITDHWGFNNGKTYPSSGFSSSNKAPNSYYTDSGVLSEIRYPTGGTAQFEYELHDYAKVVNTKNRSIVSNQSGMASGLRIKKIITDAITREFFYKETPTSSVSSGVLNMLPQYQYSINGTDCGGESFSMTFTHSMPVIPLTKDNEGLYIGYTHVCERVSGGNGGYTQYYYTNHDNGYTDVLLTNGLWRRDIFPSDPHCSRYFERGRLRKETSYNAAGQIVAVSETTWNRYGSQGEDNPRAFFFEGLRIGYDYCSSVAYLHYCYKFLPSQKIEILYNSNGQNPVITTTNYTYNSKKLLSTTDFTHSDGKKQTTQFIYPFEIDHGSEKAVLQKMTNKNILSEYVDKISYLNDGKVIYGEHRKFKEFFPNVFMPERIDLLRSQNISTNTVFPTHSDNKHLFIEKEGPSYPPANESFSLYYGGDVTFNMYLDEYIDVSIYAPENHYFKVTVKNGGSVVYTYGSYTDRVRVYDSYNYGNINHYKTSVSKTLPLSAGNYTVELTHNAYGDPFANSIGYQGDVYISFTEKARTIADNTVLQPEVYYQYDSKGNVIEIKPAGSQIPTSYIWSYNYQYPIAEIQGVSYQEVINVMGQNFINAMATTNSPSIANINTIRSEFTTYFNTLVTTYTYKPLVGIATMTDPRGVTTYYEYDSLGRLKRTYIIENGAEKTIEKYNYNYREQ